MTTRRAFLALVGAGAAVGLAGCRDRVDAVAGNAVPDLVVAEAGPDLLVLRERQVDRYTAAVLSPRGERIYTAGQLGPDTQLLGFRPADATIQSIARLSGRWQPRITSADGSLVALTPPRPAGATGIPSGQEVTPIVVTDRDRQIARLAPAGNYTPDAFSATGLSLFVLDWLPPAAPDSYRVRQLDLATGAPTPLLTRQKTPIPPGAEETMRGEARKAVSSPGSDVLYTLYTHQPDHTHTRDLLVGRRSNVHAFVHTLHLSQEWAYCVDLPDPFGAGPAAGHTIAISPDGARLYVADTTSGCLAVIDTASLSVLTVVRLPAQAGAAYSTAAHDWLCVGVGTSLHVIDRGTDSVAATRAVAGPIVGLAADATGRRLYVGLANAVRWLDANTSAPLGELAVPGLTGLRMIS